MSMSAFPFTRLLIQAKSVWAGTAVARLRSHATPLDEPTDGSLLVLVPHPDDESLGCGGLIARATSRGQRVRVVFLTDGSGSLPGHPRVLPSALVELRQKEALDALLQLGVPAEAVAFLPFPDGGLATLDPQSLSELEAALARELGDARPVATITPYVRDLHPDHEACAKVVARLLKTSPNPCRHLQFPLWRLWCFRHRDIAELAAARLQVLDIPAQVETKRRAIAAHRSQVIPVPPWQRPTLSRRLVKRLSGPREWYLEPGTTGIAAP